MLATNPAASLLGLPSEIRQIIDNFLLPELTEMDILLKSPRRTGYVRNRDGSVPGAIDGAGLNRVCETTCEEFGLRFYTMVRFKFSIDAATRFSSNLAPEFRYFIRQTCLFLQYDSGD
jgi:hypothetical protein